MSIDQLQDKIRKRKCSVIVDLSAGKSSLPAHLLEQEPNGTAAYGRFCRELLDGLKGVVPGVRLSVAAFTALGVDGMAELAAVLKYAGSLGFYTVVDAPLAVSPAMAEAVAQAAFGETPVYPCDALIISAYPGSDCIKPFLPYCAEGKKDLFCVVRTSNKSAPELQDLLSGTRLVHLAAAELVNRFGAENIGKSGYARVGVLACASSAQSVRNLRSKFDRLFLLLDDVDYPGCNFKNCADAFDRFGHGAAVCAGTSVTCAWKEAQSDGTDYVTHAQTAVEKAKKNLARYVTIL